MKIKAIARSDGECKRATSSELHRLPRNFATPGLHPFARAREYARAVVSAKLDRMMAAPFVGALSGHCDGIYAMAMTGLDKLYTGSADGEIRTWSLSTRTNLTVLPKAHEGGVKGLATVPNSSVMLSCGVDKRICFWGDGPTPTSTFTSKDGLNAISHHAGQSQFATAGSVVEIWDHTRARPVTTYSWDSNSFNALRFNPTETSILAATSPDRSVLLFDVRVAEPLHRLVLKGWSNAVCWNPMEPFVFALANEDYNVYTFDMRHLNIATNVLQDHVAAVIDLDFSPTGADIVTGAYDRTMRLFNVRSGHSRDVYHLKRMQRIWAVRYSLDAKYVIGASDDGNVRMWKARASEKLGALSARETASLRASEAVKRKFIHLPQVKRIANHRIIPVTIRNEMKTNRTMLDSRKRKTENLRVYSGKDVPRVPLRVKSIVGLEE